MGILNYTTKISAHKSVAEIQKKLISINAVSVLINYEDGFISGLSFQIKSEDGILSFQLPANIEGVLKCLIDSRIPRKLRTKEQASRVTWRIIKDWVEAQVAMIEADIADTKEVFLPYALSADGQTMFEAMKNEHFKFLTVSED